MSEAAYESKAVSQENALAYRRAAKHGAKIAVYRCLSAYFKQERPWGSLTGVRPTKMLRDLCAACGETEAMRRMREQYDVSEGKLRGAANLPHTRFPFYKVYIQKKIWICILEFLSVPPVVPIVPFMHRPQPKMDEKKRPM